MNRKDFVIFLLAKEKETAMEAISKTVFLWKVQSKRIKVICLKILILGRRNWDLILRMLHAVECTGLIPRRMTMHFVYIDKLEFFVINRFGKHRKMTRLKTGKIKIQDSLTSEGNHGWSRSRKGRFQLFGWTSFKGGASVPFYSFFFLIERNLFMKFVFYAFISILSFCVSPKTDGWVNTT